jgi:uracil-DNA glycosylase
VEITTCPFANLPEKKRTMWALTKEEMKNCRWLKRELVAQVEFAVAGFFHVAGRQKAL